MLAVFSEEHVIELEAELVNLTEVSSVAASPTDRAVDGVANPDLLRKAGFLSSGADGAMLEEAGGCSGVTKGVDVDGGRGWRRGRGNGGSWTAMGDRDCGRGAGVELGLGGISGVRVGRRRGVFGAAPRRNGGRGRCPPSLAGPSPLIGLFLGGAAGELLGPGDCGGSGGVVCSPAIVGNGGGNGGAVPDGF
jgi:hypothetical protein